MIDGIGPFFLHVPRRRVNWSKIPFFLLEHDGLVDRARFQEIQVAFAGFARTAAGMGFNAVSLDDLAHLTDHPGYRPALRRRIAAYRREFARTFRLAQRAGLAVYVTTDLMFFNPELDARFANDDSRILAFLTSALHALFQDFPQVAGLIVRFGESDGLDVQGDFLSRVVVQTPVQARRYIQALLAVCESHQRRLIVRTWTLGAYPIGDLMWNPRTYAATFSGLQSEALVVSMKHGETDFFRNGPLCPHLLHQHGHRKMVEIQARREYEGFGEFPAFVGEETASCARNLLKNPDLDGVWVWCQTGGWMMSRRLTFVRDSPIWNEINTWVALKLFTDGMTVEEAVRSFCRQRLPGRNPEQVLRLMRLSSDIIRDLLYIREFSRQAVYFRRLRLPPQITVFWDTVLITAPIRALLRRYVHNRRAAIDEGYQALAQFTTLLTLCRELRLRAQDVERQRDLFEILAVAREYYFGTSHSSGVRKLETLIARYERKHPNRFVFIFNPRPSRMADPVLQGALALILRSHRAYRWTDRLVTLRLFSLAQPILQHWPRRQLPELATSRGMGLHHFLR
jgi:hypothetical protein